MKTDTKTGRRVKGIYWIDLVENCWKEWNTEETAAERELVAEVLEGWVATELTRRSFDRWRGRRETKLDELQSLEHKRQPSETSASREIMYDI